MYLLMSSFSLGHCYKMKVWTDFRVRVRTVVILLLVYNERERAYDWEVT